MTEPTIVHIHHHHYQTDARVSEVLQYVKAIYQQGKKIMATSAEVQAAVAEVKGKVQQLTSKFLEFDSKLDALKDDPVQLEAARTELRAIVESIDSAFAAADASEVPPTEPTE